MSADCFFVLRCVKDVENLKKNIINTSKHYGHGIWFAPQNALTVFNQIAFDNDDLCFSPTDAPNTTNVDLLISHELHYVNNVCSLYSLEDRMLFIEKLATECLNYSNNVEIYISEDNPYLPDYALYKITCDMIAQTLIKEYQQPSVSFNRIIPSVALFIDR